MPLPLEAIYSSKEELYTAIQAFAAQHHYAFTIGRSKKINNGLRCQGLHPWSSLGVPQRRAHVTIDLQGARDRNFQNLRSVYIDWQGHCRYTVIEPSWTEKASIPSAGETCPALSRGVCSGT
jgi:hypothetical protein